MWTAEEYFHYKCKEVDAVEYFNEIFLKVLNLEKEVEALTKSEEILTEQCAFARDLLDELVYALDKETRLADFKKRFKEILAETYFER